MEVFWQVSDKLLRKTLLFHVLNTIYRKEGHLHKSILKVVVSV